MRIFRDRPILLAVLVLVIGNGAYFGWSAWNRATFKTTILGTSFAIPTEYLARRSQLAEHWVVLWTHLPDMEPNRDPQKIFFPGTGSPEIGQISLSSYRAMSVADEIWVKCRHRKCGPAKPGPDGLTMREVDARNGNQSERFYAGEDAGELVAFRCETTSSASTCHSEGDQMHGVTVHFEFAEQYLPEWRGMRERVRTKLGRMVSTPLWGAPPDVVRDIGTTRLQIPRPYLFNGSISPQHPSVTIVAASPSAAPPEPRAPTMHIHVWDAKGRPFANKSVWDASYRPNVAREGEPAPAGLTRYAALPRSASPETFVANPESAGYIGKLNETETVHLFCRKEGWSYCEYDGPIAGMGASYRFPWEHLEQWRDVHRNATALVERLVMKQK